MTPSSGPLPCLGQYVEGSSSTLKHALGVVERLQNQIYTLRAEKDRAEERYAAKAPQADAVARLWRINHQRLSNMVFRCYLLEKEAENAGRKVESAEKTLSKAQQLQLNEKAEREGVTRFPQPRFHLNLMRAEVHPSHLLGRASFVAYVLTGQPTMHLRLVGLSVTAGEIMRLAQALADVKEHLKEVKRELQDEQEAHKSSRLLLATGASPVAD